MEAPLRWLAEGYQLILYGFPSVPGLLYQLGKHPSQSAADASSSWFATVGCSLHFPSKHVYLHVQSTLLRIQQLLSS
ncbi:hypothetical protein F4811DRAFT_543300 [Daldinia bambusicola]|nr:hypothetical protein F4811DRAFT_543300 [Daldinia bambusicola]